MVGVIGLVLLLGISGAYLLTTVLTRRLFRLVDMATAVGKGDLDAKAAQGGSDEVGRLTSAFNSKVEDLKRHIMEEKRMQSQLFHSGKLAAMGELASCVAHEINNPLTSIAVCAESLLQRLSTGAMDCCLPEREEFIEYLKSIEKEIHRCKRITSALLSLSNLKEPQIALTDINQLIENMVILVRYQAERTGKEIILKLRSELPLVLADGDRLQQVFLNIMINALDHTDGRGRVEILTRISQGEDKSWVQVVLSDNGRGIPKENMDKIFQPFFTTKKDGTGSGLGLSISKRIVEEHNGKIEVTSQLNKGSIFSIYLPLDGS
jgi:two-component system NtrC family sensor kinase